MKKVLFLCFGLMLSWFAVMAEEWSDEQIKKALVYSSTIEDDFDVIDREFASVTNHCSDVNRLARLMCEVFTNETGQAALNMLNRLGTYGTYEQLPFLYSVVTNDNYGCWAASSIIKIGGITSNSVSLARSFMFTTNYCAVERIDVAIPFIRAIGKANTTNAWIIPARDLALQYMATKNYHYQCLDREMIAADSSFEFSKRRLRILRAVLGYDISTENFVYVTNAIATLVAYPESNLLE